MRGPSGPGLGEGALELGGGVALALLQLGAVLGGVAVAAGDVLLGEDALMSPEALDLEALRGDLAIYVDDASEAGEQGALAEEERVSASRTREDRRLKTKGSSKVGRCSTAASILVGDVLGSAGEAARRGIT